MGKIGQNPKIGQLWRPVAPEPYVVLKADQTSETLTLGLQRGVNGISLQCIPWPVACSEWSTCLTPSKFEVLGANDPWMETFNKFLSKICVLTTIHVPWPNLAKIGCCEVAEKSSRIAYKKNSRVGDTLEPPISSSLSRSRPKFRERCRPFTYACVPTLVRIGYGLPDLFRKESEKWKQ